jgi:hypothetical protein
LLASAQDEKEESYGFKKRAAITQNKGFPALFEMKRGELLQVFMNSCGKKNANCGTFLFNGAGGYGTIFLEILTVL